MDLIISLCILLPSHLLYFSIAIHAVEFLWCVGDFDAYRKSKRAGKVIFRFFRQFLLKKTNPAVHSFPQLNNLV